VSYFTDKKKKERTSRGAYAQSKVQQFLKDCAARNAQMDWERIYDAKSSRGAIPARPGDYAVFAPGQHIWIEVKETKHTHRISKSKLTQIPKLRIRELAGGTIFILIYHSTLKKWRCPSFEIFKANSTAPSWDLNELPLYNSVGEAIASGSPLSTLTVWRT